MSKGRTWTAEEKAKIVVQGWKRRAVSEICNKYQIHQTQYYKWREPFLENIPKVFETKAQSKKEERLEWENRKLKTMVGGLTMELKKTIGKTAPAAKRGSRRIRPRNFADYSAAQSGTSVLGLSLDVGLPETGIYSRMSWMFSKIFSINIILNLARRGKS